MLTLFIQTGGRWDKTGLGRTNIRVQIECKQPTPSSPFLLRFNPVDFPKKEACFICRAACALIVCVRAHAHASVPNCRIMQIPTTALHCIIFFSHFSSRHTNCFFCVAKAGNGSTSSRGTERWRLGEKKKREGERKRAEEQAVAGPQNTWFAPMSSTC